SSLLQNIRKVFSSPFIKQELRLEQSARSLRMWEPADQNKRSSDEQKRFIEPLYLLLSTEEGGFARHGFWFQGTEGNRRFVDAEYIDMVVDEDSVAKGDFEEIFAHEMGHAILRILLGSLPDGMSRKLHLSMAITDYPTAFDEGYAEHFQTLVRDS